MLTARVRRAAVALAVVIACTDVVAGAIFLQRSPDAAPISAPTHSVPPVVMPPTTPAPAPSIPAVTPPPQSLAANTVKIPALGVTAPVDVCQIIDGALEPPANVHRTCRWAGGAGLVSPAGTTVLTGHINWVGQGTGALGNIGQLHAGDAVYTSSARGTSTRWRVVSVSHRPKSTGIDTAAFVGQAGARQLYLITCGGAFDASDRNYLDNIYVRAVPA